MTLNRSLYAAAPAATLVVALVAPAVSLAQAPTTIAPQTACIRFLDASVKTFPLNGAGFAPNAPVTIASDGAALDTATADQNGSFSGLFNAPALAPNSNRKSVSITADDGQGHVAGPVPLPEVRLTV